MAVRIGLTSVAVVKRPEGTCGSACICGDAGLFGAAGLAGEAGLAGDAGEFAWITGVLAGAS
ncbi:hypothetical protein NBRC116586_21040 [Pseudooceanicola nitratireducens]